MRRLKLGSVIGFVRSSGLSRNSSLKAGLIGGVAACVLILASIPARAVSFEPLSIEALAKRADVVVQGRVSTKTCLRDPAGRIYTRVELQVIDLWKGAIPGNPVVLLHGGGTLGDKSSVISGQVEYQIGEEVVAFLVRNTRGEAVTLGLMQGKFHIWKDAVGTKLAASPFHGFSQPGSRRAALQSGWLSPPSLSGDSPDAPLTLAALKKKVQEAVR